MPRGACLAYSSPVPLTDVWLHWFGCPCYRFHPCSLTPIHRASILPFPCDAQHNVPMVSSITADSWPQETDEEEEEEEGRVVPVVQLLIQERHLLCLTSICPPGSSSQLSSWCWASLSLLTIPFCSFRIKAHPVVLPQPAPPLISAL